MKLSFHRSQKMSVKIQKPGDVRAFVFEVQIGIGKNESAVDPFSGMLLNLVKVDEILQGLKSLWDGRAWGSLSDLLAESQSFLQTCFQKENVLLREVILNESRHRWVGWRWGQSLMGQEEVREIEGEIYRLRWNLLFDESNWQQQSFSVNAVSSLKNQSLLLGNSQILEYEFEHLASGERWNFRKV